LPTLIEGEYIDLVDYTGRQVYPGERGVIKESEPKALDKLGFNPEHWAHRVQGFGFELAFWRQWRQAAKTAEARSRGPGCLVSAGSANLATASARDGFGLSVNLKT